MQKVEIVFPPRRVSHYFSDAYHPHKHDNPILTCDNYCHTVQSTEEVSGYDVHTVQTVGSTDPTDITLTNSDETKNTELEQFSIDRVTSPTNSLKFTNKCPENRSNNIIPLKMKRIIRKPKIILRTSRFGKTQVLNHTPQQLPAVESIPTIDDIATRLDSAIEIPIKSVTNEEMLSECSKHGDIVKQEQDLELISIEPMVNFVTTDPQSNECNDEFHGFGFDEKSSQALVQIKHLEKVLHNFNNFQEHPEITTQSITPNISQFTEIETSTLVLEHNEPQNQTKDLNNFTFTKDDIERLNETLKNTNSCSVVEDVELENIKLKLIIKHLMDKLHVNTLQETFVFDEEAEVTKDDKKEATEEVFYAEEQGGLCI